jgi:hypothetical protein
VGTATTLQFCRDLGFTITSNADDPPIVRATLALRPARLASQCTNSHYVVVIIIRMTDNETGGAIGGVLRRTK